MDEPYDPYDRVALEQLFAEPDKDLTLRDGGLWRNPAIELLTNTRAARVDRDRRVVTDQGGTEHPYDELVFATGSRAAVIPIPGSQHAHVFRTVDDVRTMVSEAARLQERLGRRPRAVVVGGGLLGLEAAEGLKRVGADPVILDVASWLLSVELDQAGGYAVNEAIRATGIEVECGAFISSVNSDNTGEVVSVSLAQSLGDESAARTLPADMVVMAAGIRPNDELAKAAGLRLGERGDRYPAAEVVTTAVRRDQEVPLAPQVLGYLTPADAATVAVVCDERAHPRTQVLGALTVITIGTLDDLAVHLQHEAQHPVGRRVLRPEIHGERLDLRLGGGGRGRHYLLLPGWAAPVGASAFSSPGSMTLVMPSHGLRKSKDRKSWVSLTGS